MPDDRYKPEQLSDFMNYLASGSQDANGRIPSLANLSKILGISIATLREQLEVARALGLVSVQPKTGIRRQPYSFRPAITRSLSYAISIHPEYFQSYADLRKNLETAYFQQAAALLTEEDRSYLCSLVDVAKRKLYGSKIQIPHWEHRELHLTIYRRLNNPFVIGIFEAYWDLYEAFGLDMYNDFNYLEMIWKYHEKMVNALCDENISAAFHALVEHVDLITLRKVPSKNHNFE